MQFLRKLLQSLEKQIECVNTEHESMTNELIINVREVLRFLSEKMIFNYKGFV